MTSDFERLLDEAAKERRKVTSDDDYRGGLLRSDVVKLAFERLEARIEAVRAVIERGYRGVGKTDKCEHDRYGFEDCVACYDEALLAALDGAALKGDAK